MEKSSELDEETLNKSIFPDLETIKYEKINDSIKGRKLYIGDILSSICDLKKKIKSKDVRKQKSLEFKKRNLDNIKLNIFLKPKSRTNLNYISATENPVLPRTCLIEKLKQKEKLNNLFLQTNQEMKKKHLLFFQVNFILMVILILLIQCIQFIQLIQIILHQIKNIIVNL